MRIQQHQRLSARAKVVRSATAATRATTPAQRPAPYSGLLTLQRTLGNRATGRLLRDNAGARALQAKLATSAGLRLLIQRDTVTETEDPWDKLSGPAREKAEGLFEECENVIHALLSGQQAHMSLLRQSWLNTLQKMLARIGTLDSEAQLQGARNAFDDYTRLIGRNIAQFKAEWAAVKDRYVSERRFFVSAAKDSVDMAEALTYLDIKYNETPRGLDMPLFPTTPEDYLGLQDTLDHKKHLRHGMLAGARTRGKRLKEMLDVVEELHVAGQSADKYIPGWNAQVGTEAAHLEKVAGDSVMAEYREEILALRTELLEQRKRAAEAHPREKTFGEKAIGVAEAVGEFAFGAVEAVVGPFVEAAKEAVDLAQITLHFASFGKYEPKFVSDMAAAAEQGQGTTDLLKGMAVGILETPSRFLKALEDGDWEAVGRETVNLYGLAKAIEAAPEMARKIKNLPEMLVKVRRGLRIFKARKVALELQYEGRLAPEPPAGASSGRPASAAGAKAPTPVEGAEPKPTTAATDPLAAGGKAATLAEASEPGGHKIRIRRGGAGADVVLEVCTQCVNISLVYRETLGQNPGLAKEFRDIQTQARRAQGMIDSGDAGLAAKGEALAKSAAADGLRLQSKLAKTGITRAGVRFRPEPDLLGEGRHGLEWKDTDAIARARSTGNPQGKFGGPEDIQFAAEQASLLGPGNETQAPYIELPPGTRSTVFLPDGTQRPATHLYVKVRPNGSFHAYPL